MLAAFDHRRFLIPFRSQLLPHILTDTLVIGGGVAGMRAALEASEHGDVIMLLKRDENASSTAWAQGGISAAIGDDDSPRVHEADTLAAGAGLCHPDAVRALVDGAPDAIDELLQWNMPFDRTSDGSLDRGREAAHTRSRILHAGGAATGSALVSTLKGALLRRDNVRIFRDCFALDLMTSEAPEGKPERVLGAITHHPQYGLQIIWARATILASGGAGQAYRESSNPRVATGDGIAMAYRAGAEVTDLEFTQFHPTTLYVAGAARLLLSEALRGAGAHLVDQDGRRFMVDIHDDAELAPRDIVSRAIARELARSQAEAVFLDARHFPSGTFARRFPNLLSELAGFDLDPERDLIPVHPAAHYTIGGVRTDLDGRTNLPGLFACGETACNGIHGANRLASNSLLEGLVFGRRAGLAAAAPGTSPTPLKIISEIPAADHAELDLVDVRSSLRSTLWRNVGIERSGSRLTDVKDMFTFWARYTMDMIFDDIDGWEVQNLLLVGALMTQAAQWRAESRGVHCRTDHPGTSDDYRANAIWRRGRTEPHVEPLATGVHG